MNPVHNNIARLSVYSKSYINRHIVLKSKLTNVCLENMQEIYEFLHLLGYLLNQVIDDVSGVNHYKFILNYRSHNRTIHQSIGYAHNSWFKAYNDTGQIVVLRLYHVLLDICNVERTNTINESDFKLYLKCLILELYKNGYRCFSSLNFRGLDLSDCVFENCDFQSTCFNGGNLANVHFINCTFTYANFSGCIFDNTVMDKCNIDMATLSCHSVLLNLKVTNILGVNRWWFKHQDEAWTQQLIFKLSNDFKLPSNVNICKQFLKLIKKFLITEKGVMPVENHKLVNLICPITLEHPEINDLCIVKYPTAIFKFYSCNALWQHGLKVDNGMCPYKEKYTNLEIISIEYIVERWLKNEY